MPIENSNESDRLIRFRGDGVRDGGNGSVYSGLERRHPRGLHDHRAAAVSRVGQQIVDGFNNYDFRSFQRQPGVPEENLQAIAYDSSSEDRGVAQIFRELVLAFDRLWRDIFSGDHDYQFRATLCSPVEDNEAFRAAVFRDAIRKVNKQFRGRVAFVLPEEVYSYREA